MFERSTPGEDSSKYNSVGKLGRLRDGRGFAEAGRLLGRTQQAHDLLARLLLQLRLQLGLQHTGEHRKKASAVFTNAQRVNVHRHIPFPCLSNAGTSS